MVSVGPDLYRWKLGFRQSSFHPISRVLRGRALHDFAARPAFAAGGGPLRLSPPGELLFISSNGWDAAGARAFGLPVAWVNRTRAPVERLGVSPDVILADLSTLPALLTAKPR